MKYTAISTATGEAEALMYQAMLKQHGIHSLINLPTNQNFLRTYYGGASLPFDVWEIRVAVKDAEAARKILPEPAPQPAGNPEYDPNLHFNNYSHGRQSPNRRVTAGSRFAKWYLFTIGIGVLYALIEMIKFFMGDQN